MMPVAQGGRRCSAEDYYSHRHRELEGWVSARHYRPAISSFSSVWDRQRKRKKILLSTEAGGGVGLDAEDLTEGTAGGRHGLVSMDNFELVPVAAAFALGFFAAFAGLLAFVTS